MQDWIAVDWRETRQRAWAMRGTDLRDRRERVAASGDVAGDLGALIGDWLAQDATLVLACGALGPVGGAVPCKPLPDGLWSVDAGDPRIDLRVVPGLRQAAPVDLMRGDETRIAGFLALNKDWDGVLCLVGEETRWVHVSAGEVVSFQSFLTGAMFDALARGRLSGDGLLGAETDLAAFSEALSDAMAKPERVMARIHGVHAARVLEGLEPPVARARLFGALLGAELAAARPFWLGQQLAVVGDGEVARLYVEALSAQGAPAALADEARVTLEGLKSAWRLLAG
ncbi:2-dehydro-3-deoxygalactonokinase [Ruegeria sediminis]|uniref:2-dehydro-3-deoxygalactonokinase n=1 Tax=Ruegeria sediminis TaxID=2583820 RepID=UPI003CCC7A47